MMRDDDTFVDLDERVVRANRSGDLLVSIHFNQGGSGLHGPEVFYWRVDSYGLAHKLQSALLSTYNGNANSRGLTRRRIRLTRNPEIPAVLVECGYLSNATEMQRISNPGFRQALAQAIAGAITVQAYQGDGNIGPLPPPIQAPPSRASDPRE
jgi:N-acetylmuramoyl-L-alanine amidase